MPKSNKVWKAGALHSVESIEKRREYYRQKQKQQYHYGANLLRRYKLMKGCRICGYKKHHAGLQFNHINPADKSFDIGKAPKKSLALSNKTLSKKRIKDEILDKCEVLCATCHNVLTYEEKHYLKKEKS